MENHSDDNKTENEFRAPFPTDIIFQQYSMHFSTSYLLHRLGLLLIVLCHYVRR